MKRIDIFIIAFLIVVPLGIGVFQISKLSNSHSDKQSILSQFQKKIAVISLEGVIESEDEILSQIDDVKEDKSVCGLVFRVNSPGGAVAPSQEIYHAILRYRRETKNPVYMSMGTIATSGGYYIASAGDLIFANSGTLTGSIGVIMQFSHYQNLMKKFGVEVSTITAGKLKDAGSPYRSLSESDSAYFKELLKDTHEQFIKDVSSARKMNIDSLRIHTEGQIFTGNMAKRFGLVDSIGTYDDCCVAIRNTLKLPISTEFVDFSAAELSPFEKLFEMHSPLKKIIARLFPRSGVYFLAEELQ